MSGFQTFTSDEVEQIRDQMRFAERRIEKLVLEVQDLQDRLDAKDRQLEEAAERLARAYAQRDSIQRSVDSALADIQERIERLRSAG